MNKIIEEPVDNNPNKRFTKINNVRNVGRQPACNVVEKTLEMVTKYWIKYENHYQNKDYLLSLR